MTDVTAGEINRKLDQCLKDVYKELKGIWNKLDQYSKCDTDQERTLATIQAQLCGLEKITRELIKKVNGGVGSSRACIQHHDMLESIMKDLETTKIRLSETMGKEDERHKQLDEKHEEKTDRIFREIGVIKRAMYIAFGIFLALQFVMPLWIAERASNEQVEQILEALESHDQRTTRYPIERGLDE